MRLHEFLSTDGTDLMDFLCLICVICGPVCDDLFSEQVIHDYLALDNAGVKTTNDTIGGYHGN